jgi:hypothetical protein
MRCSTPERVKSLIYYSFEDLLTLVYGARKITIHQLADLFFGTTELIVRQAHYKRGNFAAKLIFFQIP